MSTQNWIKIGLGLAVGLALGLYIGLVLAPVKYIDATPALMRADYRADYVLMIAEAYQKERDPFLAARRLATFGGEAPERIVKDALEYGRENGFSPDELALLQDLLTAMQIHQPAAGSLP